MRSAVALAVLAGNLLAVNAQGGPSLMLYTCTGSKEFQTFVVAPNNTIQNVRSGTTYCFDIEDFNTNVNATVWTWPCGDG
jgi:hypothetical protein